MAEGGGSSEAGQRIAGLAADAGLVADPLYRRSVKVSRGAVFAVPYARQSRNKEIRFPVP